MEEVYRLFLQRVSEGRGIAVERVAASAEGRIFGGRDARERGLVDAIGGLREAIARAKVLAGLAADARVGMAGEDGGVLQSFVDDDGDRASGSWPGVRLPRAATDLVPFLASISPLASREQILCALPFALTVR
jgi:protease-4